MLFAYEKQSSFNGFAVSLRLVSRSGDSKATLLVPVTGDRLDIAHAVVHGGIALSEAS